jgi:hypothetical protein
MAYYFIREATHLDDLTDIILAMLDLEHMLMYHSIDFKSAIHMYNKNDQFTKWNIQPQTINVIDRIIIKWPHKFSTALIKRLRKVIFPRVTDDIRKQISTHANIVCYNLHQKIDLNMIKKRRCKSTYVYAFIGLYMSRDTDKILELIREYKMPHALLLLFQYHPTKDIAKKILYIAKDIPKYKIQPYIKTRLINEISLFLSPDDLEILTNL